MEDNHYWLIVESNNEAILFTDKRYCDNWYLYNAEWNWNTNIEFFSIYFFNVIEDWKYKTFIPWIVRNRYTNILFALLDGIISIR